MDTKSKKKLIYKYYSPSEYSLDALINRYFWFSRREFLNDPFDVNLQLLETFPKFKELLENHGYDLKTYNKTLNEFAICCFTKRPDNQHFWSLYAGNFQGWCLEFEQDNLVNPIEGVPNKLHDVIYINEVPDLDNQETNLLIKKDENYTHTEPICGLLSFENGREHLFTYLLRIKNRDIWSSEEECRLILGNIYLMTHQQHSNANGYRIPWKENALKRIIIGYRIPEYLKKIIQMFAKENNVPVSTAKPDLQDRQFTIKIETI